VRVNPKTGLILEAEALQIEGQINSEISAEMRPGNISGDCSAVYVVVDRTVNILSTGNFLLDVRLVPFGYVKYIQATIGYLNPALGQAA
jgi:hypothetical protein